MSKIATIFTIGLLVMAGADRTLQAQPRPGNVPVYRAPPPPPPVYRAPPPPANDNYRQPRIGGAQPTNPNKPQVNRPGATGGAQSTRGYRPGSISNGPSRPPLIGSPKAPAGDNKQRLGGTAPRIQATAPKVQVTAPKVSGDASSTGATRGKAGSSLFVSPKPSAKENAKAPASRNTDLHKRSLSRAFGVESGSRTKSAEPKKTSIGPRPPSASDIGRGYTFTGRLVNGRALVRLRDGRLTTLPISRVAGLIPRTSASRVSIWTAEKQRAVSATVAALAARTVAKGKGGGGSGGNDGSGQEPPSAANDNRKFAANDNRYNRRPPFSDKRHEEQFDKAVAYSRASDKPVMMIGRNPHYMAAAYFGDAKLFYMSEADWKRAEDAVRNEILDEILKKTGKEATGKQVQEQVQEQVEKEMFERYNKPVIDKHLDEGGRILLASPYDEQTGRYSRQEIKYLEEHRKFKLDSEGIEMVPRQ